MHPSQRTVALIVAAGSGSRAGGALPKQFRQVRGQPMLRHSYAVFSGHPDISDIFVAIGDGQEAMVLASLDDLPAPILLIGGATRRESVQRGLVSISEMVAPTAFSSMMRQGRFCPIKSSMICWLL